VQLSFTCEKRNPAIARVGRPYRQTDRRSDIQGST